MPNVIETALYPFRIRMSCGHVETRLMQRRGRTWTPEAEVPASPKCQDCHPDPDRLGSLPFGSLQRELDELLRQGLITTEQAYDSLGFARADSNRKEPNA